MVVYIFLQLLHVSFLPDLVFVPELLRFMLATASEEHFLASIAYLVLPVRYVGEFNVCLVSDMHRFGKSVPSLVLPDIV